MRVMLLVAHGSRNQKANEEISQLALKVAQIAQPEFDAVVPAYLEFAEPDIIDGIGRCIESGASQITVVPYFLAAGNHVIRDIPAQLELAGRKYPEVEIIQSVYVGAQEAMADLVAQSGSVAV